MSNRHVIHILEATASGARKHVRYITRSLINNDFRVDLILSTKRADPDFFEKDLDVYKRLGCRVYMVDMERDACMADRKAIKEVRKILTDEQPSIVHSHCGKAGFISRMAIKKMKEKPAIVHTPHSYYFQNFNGLMQSLSISFERYLGGNIFCISDAEYEMVKLLDLSRNGNLYKGLNGLPINFKNKLMLREQSREELKLSPNQIAIGVFARLVKRKGHQWLLQSIATLTVKEKQKIKILLFGDGEEKASLIKLAEELNISHIIEFKGYVPKAEQLLHGLDVCILPSLYEGLSYNLLETLAAGVPLIASDIPANRFNLDNCPIQYAAVDDKKMLADLIRRLIDAPEWREEIGEQSSEWVFKHFTLEEQVRQLLICYRKVANLN
ncbi:MAG: glycosyltransferase [Lentisphaeria bacterium]|nr:glycosyltransferase [Lentisphaeria bacterium]NQZ70661.1 glycosyltransferase [Lentisphaeria bacterium]